MDAYRHLAVPGVLCLISFLSFSSQYLFYHIDPEPLTREETITFNLLIAALLICYARSVLTDPGHIPTDWALDSNIPSVPVAKPRWCRKCKAVKPPRAHHCKICKRFVLSDFRRDSILTSLTTDVSQRWIMWVLLATSAGMILINTALSMDGKLCFSPYVSAFSTFCWICIGCYGLFGVFLVHPSRNHLGEQGHV